MLAPQNVVPGSPADKAGLKPLTDIICGTQDATFRSSVHVCGVMVMLARPFSCCCPLAWVNRCGAADRVCAAQSAPDLLCVQRARRHGARGGIGPVQPLGRRKEWPRYATARCSVGVGVVLVFGFPKAQACVTCSRCHCCAWQVSRTASVAGEADQW